MKFDRKMLVKLWDNTAVEDQKRLDAQTHPEGVAIIGDIPYIDDGMKEHLLDVYTPEGSTGKLPLIIDIHGGGWMYGYKEININYNMALAKLGFTVVSINYRLCPEFKFDDQIKDVFAAFNWVGEHYKDYPIDIDNAFVSGDSAGAHIAAIACAIFCSEHLRRVYRVKLPDFRFRAAGFTSGAFNLGFRKIPLTLTDEYMKIILGDNYKTSALTPFASFVNVLPEVVDLPPCYMVSSKEDFIGAETKTTDKAMTEYGIEHEFMYWPKGKDHALTHVFSIIQPEWPESVETIRQMTDFFRRHMA